MQSAKQLGLEQFRYRQWTLKKQIVCSTCSSLILVMIFLIASINYNLSYIYSSTFKQLSNELLQIEIDNLNDLGLQVLTNYQVFREHGAVKTLNLTHDILLEALYPTKLKPYPLDTSQVEALDWETIANDPAFTKDATGRLSYDQVSYGLPAGETLTDSQMRAYAQVVSTFNYFFHRTLKLRAGQRSNINIAGVFVMFQNPDPDFEQTLVLTYPAQDLKDNVPSSCEEASVLNPAHATLCTIWQQASPGKIHQTDYVDDPFGSFGKVIIMSKGLFDPGTGSLLATINLQFQIGILNDLIESSISPEFSAIYSVYDTETQELVAGTGPELSQEQKDSFNLFTARQEISINGLQYFCKMIYLDPGAIGHMPNVRFQPSSLEEALDYITHPNKPEYAKTYDFQVFLCHDFASVTQQMQVLLDGIEVDNRLSILYVYLVTFFSFFLIGYMIYKFSIYVTKPITHLTVYTKRYKKAKGMDEKERIIRDIEEDDLFEVTKLQLEKEQLDRGDHSVKILRRQTINKSSKLSQLERKHTKRSEKEKEVQQRTKNMDLRCQDEIDELKKIFFQFFVQPANVTQADSSNPAASDKKVEDYGTDGRL